VAQFLHPIHEQTGSDLKPRAVEQGTFKGNTAHWGPVTDTQAAIVGAKVTATSHETRQSHCTTSATNLLLANLSQPYTAVNAPGFKEFIMTESCLSFADDRGCDSNSAKY